MKTITKQDKRISALKQAVRMPDSPHNREIFSVFVKHAKNLLVPVRRQASCMPPRAKELKNAGFLPADAVTNVPNARYLWRSALNIMLRRGLVRSWPEVNENTKRCIKAYKIVPDMCIETVIKELNCSESEGEWLKAVTNSAGRVNKTQTLMDHFMCPKSKTV